MHTKLGGSAAGIGRALTLHRIGAERGWFKAASVEENRASLAAEDFLPAPSGKRRLLYFGDLQLVSARGERAGHRDWQAHRDRASSLFERAPEKPWRGLALFCVLAVIHRSRSGGRFDVRGTGFCGRLAVARLRSSVRRRSTACARETLRGIAEEALRWARRVVTEWAVRGCGERGGLRWHLTCSAPCCAPFSA